MQWDMNKRPSVQEIENHPFLKNLEIAVFVNENVKNVIEKPFQHSWINPEKTNVKKSVGEIITGSCQKKRCFEECQNCDKSFFKRLD